MSRMLNAVKILFSGKGVLDKQLCLFSVCGLFGLIAGYLALWQENYIELTLLQKLMFMSAVAIYVLFVVGYEVLFLQKRELPNFDMDIFKVATKKILLIVFGVSFIFNLLSVFSKYTYFSTCASIVLGIPLTMILAGFSYEFSVDKVIDVFKNIKLKDYLLLLLKRIWVVIASYLLTFVVVFLISIFFGIFIGFHLKGDMSSWAFWISSHQQVIAKLAAFLMSILLSYSMFLGTLAWDYELIKTYEDNIKND